MIIRTASGTSRVIEIQTPAKLNLFLEVQGKRDDGYHEIETLMCPISLFDRLVVEKTDGSDIELVVELPGGSDPRDPAWQIPTNQSNLVHRAAERVQRELNTRRGCRITLTKSIPASAGLGGGSSDAAATIVACLLVWSSWNRQLATSVCRDLGSDIPFFLGNSHRFGLTLATGRGEVCALIPSKPPLEFMVTHPPVGCSTAAIYASLEIQANLRQSGEIIAACEDGQFQKIGARLFNALQFSAVDATDWIARQLEIFSKSGAMYSLMSGSGSSCFAMIEDHHVAQRIRKSAVAIGLKRVFEVQAWYGPSIESQIRETKL